MFILTPLARVDDPSAIHHVPYTIGCGEDPNDTVGYLIAFDRGDQGQVAARLLSDYDPQPNYRDPALTPHWRSTEQFCVCEDPALTDTGFLYICGDDSVEPLEDDWWLYSAARYYRDHVLNLSFSNNIARILFPA